MGKFEKGNKVGNRFAKGTTGNPHGRPPYVTSKKRLKRILETVIKAKNPLTGEEIEAAFSEHMDWAIINKAINGDTAAYVAILDRCEGKAVQTVDMNVDDTKHNMRYMPQSELDAALEKRFRDNGLSVNNEDLE
jgi:Family of unknown function (DUF5681)